MFLLNYLINHIIIPNRNYVKRFIVYNSNTEYNLGEKLLKTRKQEYGSKNVIGKNVEKLRKSRGISQRDFISRLQVSGLDINPTSYSKLEGQVRIATDIEVFTIAKVLNVAIEELF